MTPSRRALADCRHIELEGTFTHFASAEDFTAQQTDEQEQVFRECLARLRALGVSPGIVHMANSGAICARPSTWVDMVRPGAILYGYYQSFDPPQKGHEVRRRLPIEPSLSLRARIITLRDLPPGQGVGYGARFVTERPSRIAVINAGYADGISRLRTNRGCALVRGKRVPLVGTISMDLTTLDVTDVPEVALGDVVTIYGRDGEAEIHRGFRRGGGNWHGYLRPALRARHGGFRAITSKRGCGNSVVPQLAGAKAPSPSLTFRGPEGPRFHRDKYRLTWICAGAILRPSFRFQ